MIERLGQARQGEPGNASRVEEEASAIVGNPVRLRNSPAATFDGFLVHVDAPVALGIDVRAGIPQDVADVSPEVQDVFLALIRLAQLHGELPELSVHLRNERQRDSPLIDGFQAWAASSLANSQEMRDRMSASARASSAVSRPGRMDLTMTVRRSRKNPICCSRLVGCPGHIRPMCVPSLIQRTCDHTLGKATTPEGGTFQVL
jgi:hypothetical protein